MIYDMIWYDMIWYDMIYGMTWHYITLHYVTLRYIILYYIILYYIILYYIILYYIILYYIILYYIILYYIILCRVILWCITLLYYTILYYIIYPLVNLSLIICFPFSDMGWMTEDWSFYYRRGYEIFLFSEEVKTSSGAVLSPVQWVSGAVAWVSKPLSFQPTTHVHLVPELRSVATIPLPFCIHGLLKYNCIYICFENIQRSNSLHRSEFFVRRNKGILRMYELNLLYGVDFGPTLAAILNQMIPNILILILQDTF